MENHPIPQDVTGFKFKLVGSVTLKQFGYLLGAGAFATIVFLLPIPFIIRIPFILVFSMIGVALAFVPIEGRPMDKMIMNFIKTIPSENQFVYRKKGVNLGQFSFFQPPHPLVATVAASPTQNTPAVDMSYKRSLLLNDLKKSYEPDDKEIAFINNVNSLFTQTGALQGMTSASRFVPPQKTTEAIQTNVLPPIQAPTSPSSTNSSLPQQTSSPIQPPEQNFGETERMQKTLVKQAKEIVSRSAQNAQPQKVDSPISAGFPTLPDVPNIVLGIIRDPRGKVLQNILVEVMDSNNIPVRAFKTNALGQFAAATPLQTGNYTVFFKDSMGKNEFSPLQIALDGTIFQPIEIVSVDQREKLRQELFGNQASM